MSTLGETFRAARESRHETVDDAARVLKIRRAMLAALEQGNFDFLPGGAVNIGFIRTYAGYLGLDPEQAIEWYREEIGAAPVATKLEFHAPPEPARRPGLGAMFTGFLVGALVLGGWVIYARQDAINLPQVSEVPERLRTLFGQDTDPAVPVSGLENDMPSDRAGAEIAAASRPSRSQAVDTGAIEFPSGDARIAAILPPLEPENLPTAVERQVQVANNAQEVRGPVAELPPTPEDPVPPVQISEEIETEAATSAAEPAEVFEPQVETAAALSFPVPPDPINRIGGGTSTRRSGSVPASPSGSTLTQATVVPTVPQRIVQGTSPNVTVISTDVPTASNASPNGTTVIAARTGGGRVIVRAISDAWIQVEDGDGKVLFSRVLKADETYRPPNKPGVRMVTGSAGALRLTIDGRAMPPIGKPGSVVRGIPLEPSKLESWANRQR